MHKKNNKVSHWLHLGAGDEQCWYASQALRQRELNRSQSFTHFHRRRFQRTLERLAFPKRRCMPEALFPQRNARSQSVNELKKATLWATTAILVNALRRKNALALWTGDGTAPGSGWFENNTPRAKQYGERPVLPFPRQAMRVAH